MGKGRNIEQVGKMFKGEHATQRKTMVGYTNTTPLIIRNIGDVWEEKDIDGKVIAIWEQHDGFLSKKTPTSDVMAETRLELNSFPNCRKAVCECINPTRLDKVFRNKMGMCANCVAEYEDILKLTGKFDEYQKNKMLDNVDKFFNDSDQYIDELVTNIESGTAFVVEGGDIEKWSKDKAAAARIKADYEDYKQYVKEVIINEK